MGNAQTETVKQCALECVIFNVHVPLLLSNRLAVKVQRAATENKSHGSRCFTKQRRTELACERMGETDGDSRKNRDALRDG